MFKLDKLEEEPQTHTFRENGPGNVAPRTIGGEYAFDGYQRQQVESMVGMGLTQEQIAEILGVSVGTLHNHFKQELATGTAKANFAVAQNLFNIATSRDQGCVPAAIFWMKARGKWRQQDDQDQRDNQVTINVIGGLPDPAKIIDGKAE
jgi:hypothetical protein